MKSLVTLLILVFGVASVECTFVLSPRAGNDASAIPFFVEPSQASSVRYQQVYGASDFSDFYSNAPIFITQLSFAPGPGSGSIERTLTNIQINLSTTQRMPDGLSGIFSQNVGPDDTVVLSGSLYLNWAGGENFSIYVPLQRSFLYDPRAGNLLLDLRNYRTVGTLPPSSLPGQALAETRSDDTVSGVAAFDVNSPTATLNLGSIGLLTRFTVWPIPKVSISRAVNSVVLRWLNQPGGFTVEQCNVLGPGASWQPATGVVSTNGNYKEVRVALQSTTPARFFRLVLPPPTNALQQAASEFVIPSPKP